MKGNIHKTFFKIADFISWKKQGRLILSPEFQRRSVWKEGAKSFLIDTIVRGFPIPIIFIRDKRIDLDDFEATREIVDGQQRLRTVISYVCPEALEDFDQTRDDFTVKRTHNKEIAGKKYSELDKDIKEKILEYEFNVHILPPRMDDREIIQIFRRMNSTTYSLKKQELRNAQFFGEFKDCVYDLAAEQLHRWRKWKTFTEDDIARMTEVEIVSECLQIILDGEISGKSSTRIDNLYKDYDANFEHRENIEKRFRNVMDAIDTLYSQSSIPFTLTSKKTIYALFGAIYHFMYELNKVFDPSRRKKNLSIDDFNSFHASNEKIYERNAPEEVLDSVDRRTTNPKERKNLYKFLVDGE